MTDRILQLVSLALKANAAVDRSRVRSDAEMLPAFAVLALEGDDAARDHFLDELTRMAESN